MILASSEVYEKAYSQYPLPEEVYAKRAKLFEAYPEPILIVGCGFGGLVKELRKLGKDAWGIDASPYAWENRIGDYVWSSDILNPSKVEILYKQLGPFGAIITEDLLPWLTDEEAKTCAKNCSRLGSIVVHLVTEQGEAGYNYKPAFQWRNLTGQLTHTLEGL